MSTRRPVAWEDPVRGLVAAGHPVTAAAAASVLRRGGNAFDAAVAAGFAACVAEPCLTSPAGGGFLMAHPAGGEALLFDFFVAVPGIDATTPHDPAQLESVSIMFGHAEQVFCGGPASVATPGCLAGWLAVHERLGRLDLDVVVAPAVAAARDGVELNRHGAQLVGLLAGLLGRTDEGRALFFRAGRPLDAGDVLVNEALGQFIEDVGGGHRQGFHAAELGGSVTEADLERYRVEARDPLRRRVAYAEVLLNPPPAQGGALVAHGLDVLAVDGDLPGDPDDASRVVRMGRAMQAQAAHRARLGSGATAGTTHVSVADAAGNVAAMTTSNGSGSGEFAPGTGVQLNNVMGEEDLHPLGFGALPAGVRIGSMMCPTLLHRHDDGTVAFGTGGSERIRSALLQVIVDLAVGSDVRSAVERPRLHWDGRRFQVEPGLEPDALAALASEAEVNEWDHPDLYFGGVNAVDVGSGDAVGDPRRGGVGAVVR